MGLDVIGAINRDTHTHTCTHNTCTHNTCKLLSQNKRPLLHKPNRLVVAQVRCEAADTHLNACHKEPEQNQVFDPSTGAERLVPVSCS